MRWHRRHAWLAGLLVLLLAARVVVLLSRRGEIWPEELYRGTITKALLDGTPFEAALLPIIPHAGGTALLGFLAVPSFLVLGPSLTALRLTELVFEVLALVFLFRLVTFVAGARAGRLAALLFVFAVPCYANLSVLAYADHAASQAIVLAAIDTAVRLASRERLRARSLLALGGLAGLSLFFHPQAITPWPLLVIVLGILRGRELLRPRPLGTFLAGVALGGWPGLLLSGEGRIPGISLWEGTLWDFFRESTPQALGKIGRAITVDLPGAYEIPSWLGPAGQTSLAWGVHLLGWGSLLGIALARRRREEAGEGDARLPREIRAARAATWILMLYPFWMLALYGFSPVRLLPSAAAGMEIRYVAGVFPMLAAAVAVAATPPPGARWNVGRGAVAGVLLAAGLLGVVDAARAAWNLRGAPRTAGYSYETFARHLEAEAGGDFVRLVASIRHADERPRPLLPMLWRIAPSGWTERDRRPVALGACVREARGLPAPARSFAWVALGRLFRAQALLAASLSPDERAPVIQGLAVSTLHPLERSGNLEDLRAVAARLRPQERPILFAGLGCQIGFVIHRTRRASQRALARIAAAFPSWREDLFRGVGAGYRVRFLDPLEDLPAGLWTPRVPDARCATAFRAGFREPGRVRSGS